MPEDAHPPTALRRLVFWTVVLVPFLVQLSFLPAYGALHSSDYYGVIRRLGDGQGFTTDLDTWFRINTNVHRVTLPAILWAANVKLFDGSNHSTAVLTLALMLGIFILLERHLPAELRGDPRRRFLVTLGLSILVFNPVLAYSVGASFSGNLNFLADLLSIGCMAVLVRARGWRGLLPLPVLGALGVLTFGTHLAAWPALVAGSLILGRGRRQAGMIALAFGGVLAIYLGGGTGDANRQLADLDLLRMPAYVAAYLGSIFTTQVVTAQLIGGAGIVVATAVGWRALWPSRPAARPTAAFFTMVQLYTVGNGMLTGLGRAEIGIDQAMAIRYAMIPSLFWASLLASAATLPRESVSRRARRALAVAWLATLVSAAALTTVRGVPVVRNLVIKGARCEVAALALGWECWDDKLLRATLSQHPEGVVEALDTLRRLGHVPFNRPAPAPPRRRVAPRLCSPRPHPELDGRLTFTETVHPDFLRLRGWTWAEGVEVEEVVFLDRGHRQRGLIALGQYFHQAPDPWTGWEGFVPRHRGPLRGFVRVAGDPHFYPLPGWRRLEKIWRSD